MPWWNAPKTDDELRDRCTCGSVPGWDHFEDGLCAACEELDWRADRGLTDDDLQAMADAQPLSALPMPDLIAIAGSDDHPDCEAARAEYHARESAALVAIAKRRETFGTAEWSRDYDRSRAFVSRGYGEGFS